MVASLSGQDELDLPKASSEAIVEHLIRIRHHFHDKRWVGKQNVYRLRPVAALKDRDPSSGRDRPLQLGDYVAAACPLHLWDGWNYLGLALYSHIRGETSSAKHLAYYAELRAAMALLAAQGIGVFDRQHCVIEAPRSVLYLSERGTHEATQLYLEHWAKSRRATDLLRRILMMEQVSVLDWLMNLRHAGAWAPIGTDLLQQAGLDLRKMADDRAARNEASYQPVGIVPAQPRSVTLDADFLVDMIALLEPGAYAGAFETLDRFLCRRLIERAYEAGAAGTNALQSEEYRRAIEAMVGEFVSHSMQCERLWRFLTRDEQSSDPRLLQEAERDGDQQDSDYHLQIIGRATLLLRIAGGAIRELLDAADLSLEALKFWWEQGGDSLGYWHSPPQYVSSSDLWLDFSDGTDEIERWILEGQASRHDLLATCSHSILQATGMARFALIGLAS